MAMRLKIVWMWETIYLLRESFVRVLVVFARITQPKQQRFQTLRCGGRYIGTKTKLSHPPSNEITSYSLMVAVFTRALGR